MRNSSKLIWLVFIHILLMLILPVLVKADGSQLERFQFDVQGDTHYSRYNFTDIKNPYSGGDGWAELKGVYWLDKNKTFSPYLSLIPVFTTETEFWWQKNIQMAAGLQWYPFGTIKTPYLKSIRLFTLYAWRHYYDKPEDEDPEDTDLQIGGDYYYDNLFGNNRLIFTTWTNAGFRKTNFSLDDYDAFLCMGNIKTGPGLKLGKSILLPYVVTDWTYVPKYEERWWENFLRVGAGIRWYPKTSKADGFVPDLVKRFHVYGEVVHNVVWLGNEPIADNVKEIDFRLGFSFSTSGFLRDQKSSKSY